MAYNKPFFKAVSQARQSGVGALSSLAWPAHDVGDIALLIVASENENITLGTANGFVQVDSQYGTGTAGAIDAIRVAVFWCRATSTSMAAPTVNDSGDHTQATILTFGNCIDTGDPWDAVTGNTGNAASSIPGVTTTVDRCLIVAIKAVDNDGDSTAVFSGWTNANLTSLNEVEDYGTSQADGSAIGVAVGVKETAGATGDVTGVAVTGGTNGAKMMIALKPPAVDTTGPTVTPTPSSTSTIDDDDSIQIDVTDAGSGLEITTIVAVYGDGSADNVYSNGAFGGKFTNGTNATSGITNGTRWVIKRDGVGWPDSSLTLRVTTVDNSGNSTVSTITYTVTGYFVPSSPSVATYSPAPGSISNAQAITIDVTDTDADLSRIIVSVVQNDGSTEIVHDGLSSGFEAPYAASSTNTSITNGRRLVLNRTGGWETTGFTLKVRAFDAGGREGTGTGAYTTSYVEPAGDSTPPSISNITPASTLEKETVVEFDATDAVNLALMALLVSWDDPETGKEVVEGAHDGTVFRGNYTSSLNVRTSITNGYHFKVKRDGGWPADKRGRTVQLKFEFLAIDASGNLGVIA